ncbi:MAG: cation:proton antiporter, partial [Paludibacteraceae bacterium]|nr:cation:proton antiporter [Paludibacteraceae bacterium]
MITYPLSIIALIFGTILLVPMVCRKIRIPSIVGFIIVGMIVGPHALHLIDGSDAIQAVGNIGMLYIMLQAGIEVDVNDFRHHRNYSLLFGLYSFLFPFVIGLLTSLALGFNGVTSTLLGAMYGSHTLMTYPIVNRYGVQKNRAVNIAIGGSMLSISLALLVLAIVKSNFIYTYAMTTWDLVARVALTLLLITIVFPWLAQRFFKRWTDPNSGFLVVLTMMMVSALLADWCG